jgi:hypothetical protein
LPAHHDQRVFLAGLLLRGTEPLFVLFAVLELEGIAGLQVGGDLFATFGVEKHIEPAARPDAVVMVALGQTSRLRSISGAVKHGVAARTFRPQALGHGLLVAALGTDAAGHQFFEPTHSFPRAFSREV